MVVPLFMSAFECLLQAIVCVFLYINMLCCIYFPTSCVFAGHSFSSYSVPLLLSFFHMFILTPALLCISVLPQELSHKNKRRK